MSNPLNSESDPVTPVNVEADEASQTLFINWSDGHTTQYPIEWLRWECPCALCRGEMGLPGRLSQVSELRPDEKRLEGAEPIGRYAVMFFWGDGHHDGIYTYDFLRVNCHCPECVEKHGKPEGSYGYKNARTPGAAGGR
jgi:DUF971 family protein